MSAAANARRHFHPATVAVVLIAIAAFALIVARCNLVSFAHDEALTFLGPMQGTVADIVEFSAPGLPDNNHLMYTLLAKRSVQRFGDAEWAIRLPSMLSFVLYVVVMARLLMRHLEGVALCLAFAAALFNPALLELMSIARGYGLGIAMCVAGVYLLLRGSEPRRRFRAAWWSASALCMAVASLAHLSMLPYLAIALLVILVVEAGGAARGERSIGAAMLALAGPVAVCALIAPIVINQVAILAPQGLLNTEGLTSFHHDTVMGLIAFSLNGLQALPAIAEVLAGVAYAAVAIGVIGAVANRTAWRSAGGATATSADLPILLALLLGTSLISIAQHHVAGIAYLSGRRAVSLYPLFIATCGAIVDASNRRWPPGGARWRPGVATIVRSAIGVLAGIVLVLYMQSITLDRTTTWRYDADTRAAMRDLRDMLHERRIDAAVHLGIPWIFEPSVNYYRVRLRMTSLAPVDRSGPMKPYDYYYVPAPGVRMDVADLDAVEAVVGPLTILKSYPRSGMVLAVRK